MGNAGEGKYERIQKRLGRAIRLQYMSDSCKGHREGRKEVMLDHSGILNKFNSVRLTGSPRAKVSTWRCPCLAETGLVSLPCLVIC